MREHVTILGVLYVVLGGLGFLIAITALLLFGGLAGVVGLVAREEPDALVAVPILGGLGVILFLVFVALAIPGIVTGLGLLKLKPWARFLGIVLSVLNLLNVPLGTLVGAYGLWVLLSPEGEALFGPSSPESSSGAD